MIGRRGDSRPMAAVRPHVWPPGEKEFFARRGDLGSIQTSLCAARRRLRTFDVETGKVLHAGRKVRGVEALRLLEEQVEQLEDLHVEKMEALIAVEREFGFARDHVTVADPVIAPYRYAS